MEFNDSFETEGVTVRDVWNSLSDPVTALNSLCGRECLAEREDPNDIDFDQLMTDAESSDSEKLNDGDGGPFACLRRLCGFGEVMYI